MATTTTARQPFAPLNGSRLSNLTSLKNRQNAHLQTLTSSTKRKAQTYEADASFPSDNDSENIDPSLFLSPKRSKSSGSSPSDAIYNKPAVTNFFLTRTPASPPASTNAFTPSSNKSPRRPILNARSPIKKSVSIDTSKMVMGAYSAPAGRSPTRKRVGILNRRRATARVDPPAFGTFNASSTGLGFSIDAALSGTIPSYTPKPRATQMSIDEGVRAGVLPALWSGGASKDSWFFDIHEDTEEELATNMMEHGACTLDISSDEETTRREQDMRGKENVPPADDVSQTRTVISTSTTEGSVEAQGDLSIHVAKAAARKRRAVQEGEIEIDRSPLGDLAAEEFYAEGCDGSSVFVVASEAHESEPAVPEVEQEQQLEQEAEQDRAEIDIDTLMQKNEVDVAPVATLLQPLEKAEEGVDFEVWESGSAKGDE